MSQPQSLSEQERADLVAYLDGELSGEEARLIESRISLDARYRAEAETLKRTWDLLDFLPRADPSPSFTEKTISKVVPISQPKETASTTARLGAGAVVGRSRRWKRVLFGLGWAAALVLAAWGGYSGYSALAPREPGEQELIRDLRLIENKRYYDLLDDMDFLRRLDDPDLFGEEGGGS
jgi:anti-sigma factor RsiW